MPTKDSIASSAAWPTPVGAIALTAGFTAVAYAAAGANLGVFIGGFVATAIVVPALAAGEARWPGQLLAALGGLVGAAGVWLFVVLLYKGGDDGLPFTLRQWLQCAILLAAWNAALVGLTALLLRLRFHPVAAFSSIAILAVIWLALPFWLSSFANGNSNEAGVQRILNAYPPLVIDGVLFKSTAYAWRDHRILYAHTILGDEIPFILPESIRAGALAYLLIGALGLGLAEAGRRRDSRAVKQPMPPPDH